MTGIRQSVVFAREDTFSEGKPSSDQWVSPPPGFFMTYSLNRSTTRVQSEGSKFADTFAYGAVSGSFDIKFLLDYNYLELIRLAFEDYSYSGGVHHFAKVNNKRVPSFCARGKILNRMAGGVEDEVVELYGCIVSSFKMQASAGSSQIQVSMNGKFADMKVQTGDLMTTDFEPIDDPNLAEWMCMFIGKSATDDTYVSMIDSLALTVENNADLLYSTCTPFAVNFFEGTANFSLSASGYANDFRRFNARSFSGGYSDVPNRPRSKGLSPCADIKLVSYSDSIRDGDATSFENAIQGSENVITVHVEDCVYRMAQWQAGDGSKLQNSIGSAECRAISIDIKSSIPNLDTTNSHPVISADAN